MELEQRVKTLEYEFKILKNEIQRTLLDIQEQVLIHYYPTLRTEETGPSSGMVQMMETVRSRQVKPQGPAEPGATAIKKVSLGEIRSAQKEQADAPAAARPFSAAGAREPAANPGAGVVPHAAEEASVAKLLEWVVNSAAKVGDDRDTEKVDQVLNELQELNQLLGRAGNVEEALALLKGARLG